MAADRLCRDALPTDALLADFLDTARRLYTSDDFDETVERVTQAAVSLIPACDVASVSLVVGAQIVTRGPTGDLAERVDAVQYATGQGPCFAVATNVNPDDRYVYTADAAHDERWPAFSARMAAEHGTVSLISFRLTGTTSRGETLGALNMYGCRREAFTMADRTLGLLLGAHAGAAVDDVRRRRQLREAMASRDIIGQAKGVLMAQGALTADEAFELLNRSSQRLNLKLRDVAAQIAERRTMPTPK